MANEALNFTGRDYTAEVERLDALGLEMVPELTDLNHSDAGKALKRLVARSTDQENAYIDNAAQEGFVDWARFKQSLIDLGRTVDFLPTLAAAASTRLRLTRVEGSGNDNLDIPKYTAFGRADGLSYVTTAAVTIVADVQTADVDAIQGTVVTQDLVESDFTLPDWSKRPRVKLPRGVAAGTVELWHGTDPTVPWTNVDSFWRSTATDRHFLLELNGDDDSVWLVLGDGIKGLGFPSAETLHIRYVRCDEAQGNCGTGTIYLVPDGFANLITCSNIEPATGGAAAESIASLRRGIPAVTRAQRRGLTLADYEALLEHFPGVLHVQSLDRNDSPEWPHNYVALFVVPDGGGPMSTLLKDQIWAQCGSWGHLGPWKQRYILKDAVEVPVNVAVRIGILQGSTADAVKAAVQTAIQNLLAVENQSIGGVVTFTDLHRVVSSVAGVSWAEFDSPRDDVPTGNGQIPVAGTIVVTPA